MKDDSAWPRERAALCALLPQDDVLAWAENLRVVSIAPGVLVLSGIENMFFARRVREKFSAQVLNAVRRAFPDSEIGPSPVFKFTRPRQ